MSQAATTKSQYRYNRKQVLFLTAMSEEQYSAFQIDTAKAWMDRYWSKLVNVDAVMHTALFWRWWMCAWSEIDDRTILHQLYLVPKAKRHTRYRALHQYVFDEGATSQQYLMADFRHMRPEFEKETKKLPLYEAENKI